jgi:hypothetical protein
MNNFQKYTLLKEYVNHEFDMNQFVNTIAAEKNPNVIANLLQLLHSKTEFQEKVDKHYKDNDNMLMFPIEVAKEKDISTINLIDGLLNKQLDKLNSGEVIPDTTEQPSEDEIKNRKIGYTGNNIITEFPNQDITTAYKRTPSIGFRKESIMSFKMYNESRR